MDLKDITPIDYQTYLTAYNISDTCLYTYWTRFTVSQIPAKVASSLLAEAVRTDRYYNEFVKLNNEIVTDGVNSCFGPVDFPAENLDHPLLGSIAYETWLILPQLLRINKSLACYNIQTVQSEPSYYNNMAREEFESYFQIPFVDFSGPVESIEIYKKFQSDPRLSNCFFNTFYKRNESGEIAIRFFIGRPFIDFDGNPNSGFSDDDFWETICTIAEELASAKATINL
jgi:hypothetical protein